MQNCDTSQLEATALNDITTNAYWTASLNQANPIRFEQVLAYQGTWVVSHCNQATNGVQNNLMIIFDASSCTAITYRGVLPDTNSQYCKYA